MVQVREVPNPMGTGEYLGQWLTHVRGRVRTKTYEGYEALIRRYALPAIGETPLSETTPLDLQHLYSSLMADPDHPISAGTVLNLHLVLTQAFGQAVRWGLLGSNPATGAQPPRPRRAELAVVDASLAGRILEAIADHPLELPCAIAVATGMRRGEILGLRWGDLDAEFKVAHVKRSLQAVRGGVVFETPKTPRSRRSVELPAFLVPHLQRAKEDQARRRHVLGAEWEHDQIVDSGTDRPFTPTRSQVVGAASYPRPGSPTSASTISGTLTRRSCCCKGCIRRSSPSV
jgi:integrase